MKKILLLIFCIGFFSMNMQAEDVVAAPVDVWSLPAIFEMDEEVTFYFDLSGGGWVDNEDVYWWVWQPSEPDTGNWEMSSEFAKCEYAGNLIWKKTFVPTEYFNMSKEDMLAYAEETFWFRMKDLTGTKGTDTGKLVYPKETVAEVLDGAVLGANPDDFSILKAVSIYFDANQSAGFAPGEDVYLSTYINNAVDGGDFDFSYETVGAEKTKMKYLGDGIYRKDIDVQGYYFIPSESDPSVSILNSEYDFQYIKAVATNGTASTDEFQFKATSLDPGTPMVYLFPGTPIFEELFIINRVNPQPGEEPISYTISSSGYPSLTGTLEKYPDTGTERNRSLYMYFPDNEGWEECPTKEVRIRLTGANNKRFFDQRVTFVSLEDRDDVEIK